MKARRRLLEFLRAGPAKREGMTGAPLGSGEMLVRADGARLLATGVKDAVSDGLVLDDGELRATAEAASWLARHGARATHEPFARQHRAMTKRRVDRTVVDYDGNHSPLTRLAQQQRADGRCWIEPEGVEAGERLARDFAIGGLRQRVTSSWDPTPRAAKNMRAAHGEMSDRAIDARARLDRALAALGPDLAGVTLDVCCFEKGTSQVERERRWPPRSAKLMLRTALDLLVRHYGLKAGEGRRAQA